MNEAELLLLVRIGDVKAEVENADAYDMSLPDDDKQTTDPAAATAEINNCRRRRVDAAMRGVFFMLLQGDELLNPPNNSIRGTSSYLLDLQCQ